MLCTKIFLGNDPVVPTKSQCLWLHYTAIDRDAFNFVSVRLYSSKINVFNHIGGFSGSLITT
jgi:hypothetical protein